MGLVGIFLSIFCVLLFAPVGQGASVVDSKKKHHRKHHHHKVATAVTNTTEPSEEQITGKMKSLEAELAKKEEAMKGVVQKGRIEVNGPLPADFSERFARAVAQATGCDPTEVKVVETNPVVALLQGRGRRRRRGSLRGPRRRGQGSRGPGRGPRLEA